MINRVEGDLLSADTDALVNTVNCVGIMGKGLALQFKRRYPQVFKEYDQACRAGEVQVGRMHVVETGHPKRPRFIINFPTKKHWRSPSRLEYVDDGLTELVQVIRRCGITSIAVPPLGAGNGGLRWPDVAPLIERHLGALPEVDVRLYAPSTQSGASTGSQTGGMPGANPPR